MKGAVLRVFDSDIGERADRYPFDNYGTERDLVSDHSGRIVALRYRGGLSYGGRRWYLFWIYRMGATAPKYDCEISTAGFKNLRFSVWTLFDTPRDNSAKTIHKFDGGEVELPVIEHTVTIER